MEIETHGTNGADSISAGATDGDASAADTIYGFGGNDSITSGAGDDYIDGGDGDDSLYGGDGDDILVGGAGNDTLVGGADNDTLVYSEGLDTILEGGGTDTLLIAGGTTINDITVSDYSSFDTKIVVTASTDEITVLYQRGPWPEYVVEKIAFDDGFITDLTTYNSWISGTAGNDVSLNGTGGAETIIGLAGNDTINAGAGDDDVHGGAGTDTLHGGDDDDLLHGGADNDLLYGEDGLDALYGGSGADTFVFEDGTAFNDVDALMDFSTGDGDKLDIADILDGYYTYGVDDITDFVLITDDSTDTTVSIDQDGGADNFVAIATLYGVTGLTDEAALESGGTLVTV